MIARAWHGSVALLVLAALAVQVWIAFDAPATASGHAVGGCCGWTP